jgi:hypothetical protein
VNNLRALTTQGKGQFNALLAVRRAGLDLVELVFRFAHVAADGLINVFDVASGQLVVSIRSEHNLKHKPTCVTWFELADAADTNDKVLSDKVRFVHAVLTNVA